MKAVPKISGYVFLFLSLPFLAVGIWFSIQLIIHKFDMGIHGVPHAIAIGGLFWGCVALLFSRLSFKAARKS